MSKLSRNNLVRAIQQQFPRRKPQPNIEGKIRLRHGLTSIPSIDVGVACRDTQSHNWWSPLMGQLLSYTQANLVRINRVLAHGSALTDANQNSIVQDFLKGPSEWLYMIEDDTVHPDGTLLRLLSLGRPFVSGLYYLGAPPHHPVAYFRNTPEDFAKDPGRVVGTYRPLFGWDRGELIEMDSVGMGCALIHRSVYETIQEQFVVYGDEAAERFHPIHRSRIWEPLPADELSEGGLYGQFQVSRLHPIDWAKDVRPWPFYLFDHGRTQDHWFAELCAQVGIRPLLDTSLECQHWKLKAITGAHFRLVADQYLTEEAKSHE